MAFEFRRSIRLELDEGAKSSVQKEASKGVIPVDVTAQDSVDESSERLNNSTVIASIRQLVDMALGK